MIRDLRKEFGQADVGWQLKVNATDNEGTARVRETVLGLHDLNVELAAGCNNAAARAADMDARVSELTVALELVRGTSKAGLLEQVSQLQTKLQELGKRRTLNQRHISDVNPTARREAERSGSAWSTRRARSSPTISRATSSPTPSACPTSRRTEQAAMATEKLKEQEAAAAATLKEQVALTAKFQAITEPPKEKFFSHGHYTVDVDLPALEVIADLGVSPNALPKLFVIFGRFFDNRHQGPLAPGEDPHGHERDRRAHVYEWRERSCGSRAGPT